MTRLDPEQFDRHYPQLTYEAGLFMVAYLRRLHAQFDGDLAAAIVLGEIAQHNVRRFMREVLPASGKPAAEAATDEAIAASLRRCNVTSVAEASGIPRESVRRKVAGLVAQGLVSRDAKGGLAVTRKVGQHFRDFDREMIAGLVELAGRMQEILGKR